MTKLLTKVSAEGGDDRHKSEIFLSLFLRSNFNTQKMLDIYRWWKCGKSIEYLDHYPLLNGLCDKRYIISQLLVAQKVKNMTKIIFKGHNNVARDG